MNGVIVLEVSGLPEISEKSRPEPESIFQIRAGFAFKFLVRVRIGLNYLFGSRVHFLHRKFYKISAG